MTYTLTTNQQFNSLELGFSEKPSDTIRDILKSFKFRWNPKKSIWYGFADETELRNKLDSAPEALEELGTGVILSDGYMGATEVKGVNVGKFDYTSDCFRKHFKAVGMKGVTVKKHSYSGGMTFVFTIQATTEDLISFEEFASTYDIEDGYSWIYYTDNGEHKSMHIKDYYSPETSAEERQHIKNLATIEGWQRVTKQGEHTLNQYYLDRHTEYTPTFMQKVKAVKSIVESYRHDDSNAMVDYFDVNFYYDLVVKIQ